MLLGLGLDRIFGLFHLGILMEITRVKADRIRDELAKTFFPHPSRTQVEFTTDGELLLVIDGCVATIAVSSIEIEIEKQETVVRKIL